MNGLDHPHQRQDNLKRRWQERVNNSNPNNHILTSPNNSSLPLNISNPNCKSFPGFYQLDDDDLVSTVVPPVTVVLEGRSICQRISLHKHGSYHSLAKALREMFVDGADLSSDQSSNDDNDHELDLSNAVPGHLIAYEDIENDLLLAGDLHWKDFVRVAKRIRILPVKGNSKRGRAGAS